MQTNTANSSASLNGILEKLSVREDRYETLYETVSYEDYTTLLRAALNGKLDGIVSVGRSGIYLNNQLISPPRDA
jgi:hypothetical protein